MSEENDVQGEAYDAFSPENIGVIHFIQLGRIYDVLMALLSHTAPEKAAELLEVHYNGALLGPAPRFNGTFISDDDEISHDDEDTADS